MNVQPLELAKHHLVESAAVKCRLAEQAGPAIVRAARRTGELVAAGGKIMLCGNGGSAADSQHIAAELTSRLRPSMERPGIPALALSTDTSFLTARANDFGFEEIFARLIDVLGRSGDVLIGSSTSGNSENVVRAVIRAQDKQIFTIGFLGGTGGALARLVDVAIIVPSNCTQYIQEAHIAIGHILCEIVEEMMYGCYKVEHLAELIENEAGK